ncbi:MAG: hypothetical protein LBI53_08120 [Candidatus Peribacteria bacterium]|jgi:hypothetical protein|nr:hypothetical protein [Candidatus Peribacteria bacterium]
MKYIKKILLGTLGILLIGNIFTTTFAQENNSQATKQYINDNIYTYYYGQVCGYCIKVEKYLKDN